MYKICPRCGRLHEERARCYVGEQRRQSKGGAIRRTAEWRRTSLEVRERAMYMCEVCRDNRERTSKGQICTHQLEVHHIVPIAEDTSKAYDRYNLICLCNEHHRQAESGQISKEKLQALARAREQSHNR